MPLTPTSNSMAMSNLLEVQNLKTHFFTSEGIVKAVDGVSFNVAPRETLGLIGESGCGKSVTAHSIMRIVPKPGRILGGEIRLKLDDGFIDLADREMSGSELRDIRGKEVSMVFQEPMTSLSPVHTIGNQSRETIYLHRTRDKKEATEIALDILARVGISNPDQRISEYPHQLSGGMRPARDDRHSPRLQASPANCRRTYNGSRCNCASPDSGTHQRTARTVSYGSSLHNS